MYLSLRPVEYIRIYKGRRNPQIARQAELQQRDILMSFGQVRVYGGPLCVLALELWFF